VARIVETYLRITEFPGTGGLSSTSTRTSLAASLRFAFVVE
jgi:hypothetical protein